VRRIRSRAVALALVTSFVVAATPVAGGIALADAGGRTLNAVPEEDDRALGENRTIKAILSSAPDIADIEIDFEVVGEGDPASDGASYESPDRSCTVPIGQTMCSVKYSSEVVGEDEVRAWIDEGNDAIAEVDLSEGLTAVGAANGTDVVATGWFVRPSKSATLNCSPEPLRAGVGQYVVGCRVSASSGALAGWRIDGENLGGANATAHPGKKPADHDDVCTTDAQGRCRVVLSSRETGSAKLCFWVDWDLDVGKHKHSDADGSQCDEDVNDSAAAANITDVVAVTWKHKRRLSWRWLRAPTYGQRFKLRGAVSSDAAGCRSGVAVTIRRTLLNGVKSRVGTRRTAADGSFAITLRAKRSARYTATAAGNARCYAAISPAKLVRVRR
jgi:hypothetical protein